MASDRRYVVGVCLSRIAFTTIISISPERKLLENGRNTPDVIKMVVAHEKKIDLLHAQLVKVRKGLSAALSLHVLTDIEQYYLSTWRDEDHTVALAHVHVVNLEVAVRLSKRA